MRNQGGSGCSQRRRWKKYCRSTTQPGWGSAAVGTCRIFSARDATFRLRTRREVAARCDEAGRNAAVRLRNQAGGSAAVGTCRIFTKRVATFRLSTKGEVAARCDEAGRNAQPGGKWLSVATRLEEMLSVDSATGLGGKPPLDHAKSLRREMSPFVFTPRRNRLFAATTLEEMLPFDLATRIQVRLPL